MLKSKSLSEYKFPYVVLVLKFIQYSEIDVERGLSKIVKLGNDMTNVTLHKMGLQKFKKNGLVEMKQGFHLVQAKMLEVIMTMHALIPYMPSFDHGEPLS